MGTKQEEVNKLTRGEGCLGKAAPDFIAVAIVFMMGVMVWFFMVYGELWVLVLLLLYGHAWARFYPFESEIWRQLAEHAETRRLLEEYDHATQ